ncbi:unnamed protein product [Gongylonema pulchrum]|uniref:G_PROTEIN_RECEP_F1_2 domain-containing protein n=1 Tax=Gongylonema pulchrum TaxID=637853 RepID=A0A183E621_9BILA|nr:unnamed protein product [Gongylonema pulchrum]
MKRIDFRLSERCGALIAILLFELFFILTYPWQFLGGTIRIKDVTTNATGCDAVVYEWCATSHAVSPIVYIASMVAVLGVAITLITITIDTLYSKILGNIEQVTKYSFFAQTHLFNT